VVYTHFIVWNLNLFQAVPRVFNLAADYNRGEHRIVGTSALSAIDSFNRNRFLAWPSGPAAGGAFPSSSLLFLHSDHPSSLGELLIPSTNVFDASKHVSRSILPITTHDSHNVRRLSFHIPWTKRPAQSRSRMVFCCKSTKSRGSSHLQSALGSGLTKFRCLFFFDHSYTTKVSQAMEARLIMALWTSSSQQSRHFTTLNASLYYAPSFHCFVPTRTLATRYIPLLQSVFPKFYKTVIISHSTS
jgi:hypothetical protein